MELIQKLQILGEAARYDVSCSSSGSSGTRPGQGKSYSIGNTSTSGICHTWSDDGRCISLLKVLLTNHCEFNCIYCCNRKDNDIPRASFTPSELASLTIEFYMRNYIEGLFLSSGVVKSPDHTMSLLIETVRLLRNKYSFGGYIHVKTIPGASESSVYELGLLVDRMSINVEFCSQSTLQVLAPEKTAESIISPMALVNQTRENFSDCVKNRLSVPSFVPGGQSTQFIVGASPESDFRILTMSQKLYKGYNLKRVYYSAYIPVNSHPDLPALLSAPPLLREHRLYQADWLMRFYRFNAGELVSADFPDLDLTLDPKCSWAINNFAYFPVEINRADYNTLLRVPGIGVLSAKRIISARKFKNLTYEDAVKIGVVLKRAVYFLLFNGKYMASKLCSADELKFTLADKRGKQIHSARQIGIEELNVLSL